MLLILILNTKKRTSMSLGLYPAVSLADARKLKLSARELRVKGLNPKTECDIATQSIKKLDIS
ncbi:integrase arm-type DNA-binding domain-containing protein [Psychromonas aquimarina]|uniref:integrase arm-type DNA-binding domain-containing protein n=1 Tax=Psychromonas aquimarina TaxID=444919 RepID=UPI00316ADF20